MKNEDWECDHCRFLELRNKSLSQYEYCTKYQKAIDGSEINCEGFEEELIEENCAEASDMWAEIQYRCKYKKFYDDPLGGETFCSYPAKQRVTEMDLCEFESCPFKPEILEATRYYYEQIEETCKKMEDGA